MGIIKNTLATLPALRNFGSWLKSPPAREDWPDWAKKNPITYRVPLLLIIVVAAFVFLANLLSIQIPALNVVAGVAAVTGLWIITTMAMLLKWGPPSFLNKPVLLNAVDYEYPPAPTAAHATPPAPSHYHPPRPRA